MVMEITPSPQCVGLEFVRQYYTVLNKAPLHLHRFYSQDSQFMHGGPSGINDPVVGQTNIHKKILSLNFKDCHAKIRMVDAHATLSNGVVIQVTGELSNNAAPMRRFMQTFVLAPQTTKKYYVHNDIFRYQDEVFSDDDTHEGSEGEDEPMENETSLGVDNANYSVTGATVNGTCHVSNQDTSSVSSPLPQSTTISQGPAPGMASATPPSQFVPPSSVVPVVSEGLSTTVHAPVSSSSSLSSANSASVDADPPAAAPEEDDWGAATSNDVSSGDAWGAPSGGTEEWADALEETVPSPTPAVQPPSSSKKTLPNSTTVSPPASNEPKTYANLFKAAGGGGSAGSSPYSSSGGGSQTVTATQTSSSSFNLNQNDRSSPVPPQMSASNAQSSRNEPSPNNRSGVSNNNSFSSNNNSSYSHNAASNSRSFRNFYDDDKRRPTVPDSQQVFVGNLPHSIDENQLRSEFIKFGRIVEIRINVGKGKTGPKGPGHQVPNFGFIAFEDEEAAQRCLDKRPIYLNDGSRINVEEKKARSRIDVSGPPMGGSVGGARPSSGSGRGGMRGSHGSLQGGRGSGGGGGGRGGFSGGREGGGRSGGGVGFMGRR